ncbi:hypothetical protein ANCDUO_02388 [Ancylostoma duodenale]|uniref:Receptor ligand binding region domain-containing protein n=1 Tax=Ancylostoma duodenale TaxID=51022 RepID=A0A0C2DBT0_9BILA|nr:hypothetical protein ANCDUO_02388 [Ancylostoma duodenale]
MYDLANDLRKQQPKLLRCGFTMEGLQKGIWIAVPTRKLSMKVDVVSHQDLSMPNNWVFAACRLSADAERYSPFVGYTGSIGALYLAIDKIRESHLLDDFDFNITVRYDNCVEKDAVGLASELIRDFQVDVIIGPTCNVPAIAVGVMAAYYNLPHYIWGFTTANELAYVPRFPTVIILTPNYFTYVNIIANTF